MCFSINRGASRDIQLLVAFDPHTIDGGYWPLDWLSLLQVSKHVSRGLISLSRTSYEQSKVIPGLKPFTYIFNVCTIIKIFI